MPVGRFRDTNAGRLGDVREWFGQFRSGAAQGVLALAHPIGLHLTGPAFAETLLLRAARLYERVADWAPRPLAFVP